MSDKLPIVKVGKYYEPINCDFEGNPFITAWPACTPDVLKRLLSQPVAYRDEERTHPRGQRLQYVYRLMSFYMVLDHQAEYAASVLNLIFAGYAARSIDQRDVTAEFEAMCDFALDGSGYSNYRSVDLDSWTSALIGSPGCSKTSLLRRLIGRLAPGILHHHLHGDVYQLLGCHVVAPKGSHPKQLMQDLYSALLKAAASIDLPVPYSKTAVPSTEASLLSAIDALARALNLGVLIIDEVQHLFRGSGWADERALRSLTTVMALLRIPVVLVGTWDAVPGLAAEGRLARRSIGPGGGYFRRMNAGPVFNQFLAALWRLQYTSKKTPLSARLAERMYHQTQGLPDLVVKLYALVQVRSILSEEEISEMLIDSVATDLLTSVQPLLRQLRRGKLESEVRIHDLEPLDVDDYIRAYVDEHARNAAQNSRKRVRDQLHVPLFASAGNTPAASDKPVLGPVMRGGTSAKAQAKLDAEFLALDDSDLRKIVYSASKRSESAERALRDRGYVYDLAA